MAVRRVLHQLLQWIRAVPVVGLNFQHYDLNVLKSSLMRRLACVDAVGDGGGGSGGGDVDDGTDNSDSDGTTSCFNSDSGDSDGSEADDGLFRFVVKRSNALTVVEMRRLCFLDITNFIAPGFSYERYLKTYDCELPKGYFPYKWKS